MSDFQIAPPGAPVDLGSADTLINQNGGPPVPALALVGTDQKTILGSGSQYDPLRTNPDGIPVTTDKTTIGGDGTIASPLAVIPLGLSERVPVLTDGLTAVGDGTVGSPITVITGGGGGAVVADNVTLTGFGTPLVPLTIKQVEHDGTIAGAGTVASPLTIPAGVVHVATDGTTLEGNGTSGTPLKIKQVEHDGTLAGAGTVDSLLAVVPAALAGDVAVAVDASSIAGDGTSGTPLHTVAGGTAVATDATMTGNGTTGSPLSVSGIPSTVKTDNTMSGTGSIGSPLSVVAVGAPAGFLTPEQFGAVGNGVTDDRAAIQAMLNAAGALNGLANIRFGPKVYIVGRSSTNAFCLDLPNGNLTIEGVPGRSTLKQPAGLPSTTVVILRIDQKANVIVRGMTFDGNWGNRATYVAAASSGLTLPQATINVATTEGFATSGTMTVQSSTGPQVVTYTGVTATSFTGCTGGVGDIFGPTTTGFQGSLVGYVDAQTGINQGNQTGNPTNHGIMLRGSTNVTIESCLFTNNYGDGIWVGASSTDATVGCKNTKILGCNIDMSGRNSISIAQLAQDTYVEKTNCTYMFQNALDIEPGGQPVKNTIVEDCHLGIWWNPSNAGRTANIALNIKGGEDLQPSPQFQTQKVRIRDCTITGSINIADATDIIIERCRIVMDWPGPGTGDVPIGINFNVDDVQILENYVYDSVHDPVVHTVSIAVYDRGSSSGVLQPQGVRIVGNRVHSRNGNGGIATAGVGGNAGATGTATGITSTTLTDSGATWIVGQFVGHQVLVGGVLSTISANTATTLSLPFAWYTQTGGPANTPALGTYSILPTGRYIEIASNEIDLTDDGKGQGLYGISLQSSAAGGRLHVHDNQIQNANGDAVRVSFGAVAIALVLVNNIAFDNQVVPTCVNTIHFTSNPAASVTRLVLRENNAGDGVTTDVAGITSGTWITADGYPPQFAGFGSPEGVVTAIVGSTYNRLNGGAATTLYVKESGSGNTGWIGK